MATNVVIPAHRFDAIEERYWYQNCKTIFKKQFKNILILREEMFRMMEINKPVNMGVGMPDFTAQPQSIIDAMVDVAVNGGYAVNQYTRGTVCHSYLDKKVTDGLTLGSPKTCQSVGTTLHISIETRGPPLRSRAHNSGRV